MTTRFFEDAFAPSLAPSFRDLTLSSTPSSSFGRRRRRIERRRSLVGSSAVVIVGAFLFCSPGGVAGRGGIVRACRTKKATALHPVSLTIRGGGDGSRRRTDGNNAVADIVDDNGTPRSGLEGKKDCGDSFGDGTIIGLGERRPPSLSRGGGGNAIVFRPRRRRRRRQTETKAETEASPARVALVSVSELPQFLCMSALMFLFIYVFTTVRDTKDTLVVSNCGAEAIPYLKLYGVLPAASLFILCYSWAGNLLGREGLFYVTLIPFFVFYGIFAFALYPNREAIHFAEEAAEAVVGGTTSSPTNLLRYWSFSLYFIVSELWASAGVPLLFWQCANDVTPLSQAKRFYSLFAVFGNVAPVVSGKVMSAIVSRQPTNDDIGFGQTLKSLAIIKLGICLGIVGLYNVVYGMADKRTELEDVTTAEASTTDLKPTRMRMWRAGWRRRRGTVEQSSASPKKNKKTTLRESVKELIRSSELRSMATMVVCYNLCIELTEVLWKGLLRKTYETKGEYMSFMATFSQTVGVAAFVMQICASGLMRVLGWKASALVTPLAMVLLAVPFFAAVSLGEDRVPAAVALLIGTIQNVISKVTKYSLFDPCKEMAYIPLGPEAKTKGKAAVDVLGARLGRSLGSACQQMLVSTIGRGSILNCAPALGMLYVTAVGVWGQAVGVLGRLFDEEEPKAKAAVHGPNRTEKKES